MERRKGGKGGGGGPGTRASTLSAGPPPRPLVRESRPAVSDSFLVAAPPEGVGDGDTGRARARPSPGRPAVGQGTGRCIPPPAGVSLGQLKDPDLGKAPRWIGAGSQRRAGRKDGVGVVGRRSRGDEPLMRESPARGPLSTAPQKAAWPRASHCLSGNSCWPGVYQFPRSARIEGPEEKKKHLLRLAPVSP